MGYLLIETKLEHLGSEEEVPWSSAFALVRFLYFSLFFYIDIDPMT